LKKKRHKCAAMAQLPKTIVYSAINVNETEET